jgi:hypothetical protein
MSLLNFNLTDVAWGAAMGFLGMAAYNSYRAGAISIPNPMTYLYLIKSEPLSTILPLAGGWLGWNMGARQGQTLQYAIALGGGAVGTMFAPSLKPQ